jgi:hypothetical protein
MQRVSAAVVVLVMSVLVACKGGSSSSDPPRDRPAPPPVPAGPSLADSCKAICTKSVTCGGLTGEAAASRQADCQHVCAGQGGTDPLAAEVVPRAMAKVVAKCGAVSCDKFGDCYMDSLTAMQAELTGVPAAPATSLPAETRARFVSLVCRVVAENPGKVPDLNGPNPSPSLVELKSMVNELATGQGGVGAVADLMKEAIATCSAPQ